MSAAKAYALSVTAAGVAAIAASAYGAWSSPIDPGWLLLAVLTVASGSLGLRMSSVPMSFSVSETFTFATLLLFGPAAATLTVALDGLAISLRLKSNRGLARVLFNTASPALAMWIAGRVSAALIGDRALPQSGGIDAWFFPALAVVTAVYFILQTGFVAMAVAMTSRRRVLDVWRTNFARLWVSFFGGAYFAALMAFSVQQLGPAYLVLVLPLPLLLYFMFSIGVGSVDDHVQHVAALDTARDKAEDARRASESERRELEEQLRQAQKMEAIGRLAGGVAHDFNNLLTAIVGYSDLLTVQLRGSPLSTEVDEIRGAALRAGALTQQLLAFSRKQVLTPTVLDLSTRVADMKNMLGRLLGADIDVRITAGPDLWRVRGDAGQIDQVLLNLSVNARDAMPKGGRLTISVRNADVGELDARRLSPVTPGRWVVLTVTDTGTGIDAETMRHLFEPFFTTKEYGKGTGLGLATVYGVVKQSGGHVRVESAPALGTTFSVYLPAVDAPADPQPSRAPEMTRAAGQSQGTPSPRSGRQETVLVVEDEPSVRHLVVQVLTSHGYSVLEAANGAAALVAAHQHQGPIHLVVTDVVMPGLRGPGLAGALLRERPDLKIIFMSGYTDPEHVSDAMRFAGSRFLQKPFTPTALVTIVREFLDAPDPAPQGSWGAG